jgi:hypothetical protein
MKKQKEPTKRPGRTRELVASLKQAYQNYEPLTLNFSGHLVKFGY